MAYTTLPTQSAGQTASAAGWANIVKADIESMGPHLIARKTSDQGVTSSTALVDCTTMTLPLLANEVWQLDFSVLYSASTTGDLKIGFTFPAAGRIDAAAMWARGTDAANINYFSGTTTPSSTWSFQGLGSTERTFVSITGIFTNSTNAGNLQLQFAQNTTDGTATTIYANSTVWAVKLA